MKRLLNTLYITTEGSYLFRDGMNIAIKVDGNKKAGFPVINLEGVVCFGPVMVTAQAMELCSQNGLHMSFLSGNGRFYARVSGHTKGNVILRRAQYRFADDDAMAARISAWITSAKINNARTVLMRAMRQDSPNSSANQKNVEQSNLRLKRLAERLLSYPATDQVRGIEGEAARSYFGVFDDLILCQKEHFRFVARTRRPPRDKVNAMLSFIYTIIAHDIVAALESVGLDPAVGFLHKDRPGRPSLALDLLEELRPFLGDRLVLSLINLKNVKADGFEETESGGITMKDATRKDILIAYQKRKQEKLKHPFLNEDIEIGLLPFVQATLMARFIRGALDAYPPFFWK